MKAWDGAPPEPAGPFGAAGWARVVLRGAPLAVVVAGGLLCLLSLRLIERPIHGPHRPWTPWITVAVCRAALRILGLERRCDGTPLRVGGAMVANHVSWLDIFVLNAGGPLYFVAKSEVAAWPAIGWLARATGTVFVVRAPREAPAQRAMFEARLRAGHVLCFFPEGTSTDGRRVLPFKTTLFAAFLAEGLRERSRVQAVSLVYRSADPSRPAFYGWWGAMGFAESLLKVLAAPRQGTVAVQYHEPRAVAEASDRKALARRLEGDVRSRLAAFGISGTVR